MPLTLSVVAESIRDKDPRFDPQSAPLPLIARYLSSYQRELMAKIAAIAPDEVSAELAVALPLAEPDAGAELPPHLRVLGGSVRMKGGEVLPVLLGAWADRHTPRRFPAAYVAADRLYLRGAGSQWADAEEVAIRYVPLPADLPSRDAVFALPERAEGALVAAGALFLARRLESTGERIGTFAAAAKGEESALLTSYHTAE